MFTSKKIIAKLIKGGMFMPISDKLRQIRKYYKLTQEEFANNLGISRVNLVHMEKGRVSPTPTLIKYICLAYNIDINWLTGDDASQAIVFQEPNKSDTIDDIMLYYNQLSPIYQEFILAQAKQLLKIQQTNSL